MYNQDQGCITSSLCQRKTVNNHSSGGPDTATCHWWLLSMCNFHLFFNSFHANCHNVPSINESCILAISLQSNHAPLSTRSKASATSYMGRSEGCSVNKEKIYKYQVHD